MSLRVPAGATDVSVVIRIVDSTDGTPETGVTSATAGLALWYWRQGGTVTALTESDLANIDSAHSDGAIKHAADGYYRVCSPDAAFAVGADTVLFGGVADGMVVIGNEIAIGPVPASVSEIATDAIDAASIKADAVTKIQNGLPLAANLLTEDDLATKDEVVDGVWDEATADHGTAGSTGKALTDGGTGGATAAEIRAEMDTNSTKLALIPDLPTNAELATALAAADDATLAAIGALNNLSSAQAQSAATAALNAYDPPTKAELDSGLAAADDAVLAAIAALNNLSSAGAQAAATAALSAYSAAKKADVPNAAAVADQVWDEANGDHVAAGSMGKAVSDINTNVADVQSRLGQIAPTSDTADSATLAHGTTIAGTYANTQTDDDNRYSLAPVNPGGLDVTLLFQIGLGRAPTAVGLNGYFNGSGKTCHIYAYDYILGIWDRLSNSSTALGSRNSDANYSYPLNREHMDPASGEVSIRFVSDSTNTAHRLHLDRLLVYTVADQTGGGSGGGVTAQMIWEYVARTLTSESGESLNADEISDAVWDDANGDHLAAGSTGAALAAIKAQADKLNFSGADVKATLDGETVVLSAGHGLAIEANVQGHATAALNAYDPPTKAELDAVILSAAPSVAQIDAQLSSTHGAGAWGEGLGALSKVYHVTIDGLPGAGVYCRMTSDLPGLVNIDAGTTDDAGNVTLHHNLAAGTTVYIFRSKAGVSFVPDPDTEVI